jgi:hypothetical protein
MPAEPFVGDHYKSGGLMLLGESAYSYEDKGGNLVHPTSADHSRNLVEWVVTDFEGCRSGDETIAFMVKLARALTNQEKPDEPTLRAEWSKVLFTNHVAATAGIGCRARPSKAQWAAAESEFLPFIDRYRPGHVLVLGTSATWVNMPKPDVEFSIHIGGYRLADSSLCICRAVNHPSSPRQLSWQSYGDAIRELQRLHG